MWQSSGIYNGVPHLTKDTTLEGDKNTIKHHIRDTRGQPFPSQQWTDAKASQTQSWDDFQERDGTEHRISHFGKMNVQVADMMSNTGITLNSLEKDCNYLEKLLPSKQKPEYWNILGSSKFRTGEQEQISREIIGGMLDSCEDGTSVVFTDGSWYGNPGPCGAGACIFHPGASEPVFLKQPVSSPWRDSSY